MSNKTKTKFIVVLIAIFIQQISSQKCSVLSCMGVNEGNDGDCFDHESGIQMFPKSCENCKILLSQILETNGTFSLKGLDSYKDCSTSQASVQKYNGEQCEAGKDCYSGICDQKLCAPESKYSKDCNDSTFKHCPLGQTCLNGQCKPRKTDGYECSSTLECDNFTFCHNQKCVKYGSLQNGEEVGGDKQQIDMRCSSYLVSAEGKCMENDTKFVISSCPTLKKCTSDATFSCSLFTQDKLYSKIGGLTEKIHTQVGQILEKVFSKNTNCPNSLNFSGECHLIADEMNQLKEIQYLYAHFNHLVGMPKCLLDQLLHKQLYELFSSESTQIESQVSDDKLNKNEANTEDEDGKTFIFVAVFVVFLVMAVVGGYIYFRRRKFKKLHESSQSNSEASDISNGKRSSSAVSKKSQSSNQSSVNKESLNLEYNPTSAKGDNQMDISNLQGQDPKKNGHLETSVNQNFFSIDGDDEKDVKIVDSLDENQSESDSGVSYENVFNIEGDNVDKPNSSRKRRRQTNRKKIVKKDSEKKYEVVEE